MARLIVSDELWSIVEPLIPKEEPSLLGGRPRIGDREALTGILFILKTGLPWEDLPQEMNCGCGMTCWRRLNEWQAAGLWSRLHLVLLEKLHGAGLIDWSRALVDSASAKAPLGGPKPVPTPRIAGNPVPGTI